MSTSGADFGLAVFLFVEGQAGPGLEFGVGGLLHVVVEAGDEDLAVGVLQLAQDFDQTEDSVGCGPAVHARVKIDFRSAGFDFGVEQAAKSDAECGDFGREEFGVGDQREV